MSAHQCPLIYQANNISHRSTTGHETAREMRYHQEMDQWLTDLSLYSDQPDMTFSTYSISQILQFYIFWHRTIHFMNHLYIKMLKFSQIMDNLTDIRSRYLHILLADIYSYLSHYRHLGCSNAKSFLVHWG